MKAAFIEKTGPCGNIRFAELPDPECGDGQVVIETKAVSVNPIDTYIRSGAVALELPSPYVVGCDAAGVIHSVGSGVSKFKVGDRVWCTNQGLLGRQGTFAEKIGVDAQWVYPLPDAVSFEDAAACALVGVTAHLGLFRDAKLTSGETILVIGGTGGVGSMVVQMAKAVGARVIATAGSAAKCELARNLGADVVIDYSENSILDTVKENCPNGVNVFWETRREPDFDTAVELLAERGRMLVMAGRDARPQFPVGPFYVKQCSLHGFVMFKASGDEIGECASDINRWLEDGSLRANIAKTLPVSEAARAHELQEAGTLQCDGCLNGKIVLTV